MGDAVTYVVLLNWRGVTDTIACLESLFASSTQAFRVIVCDNASGDGSLETIEAWSKGRIDAQVPGHQRLARLLGDTARPVCSRIDRVVAESGRYLADSRLILVDNGANLGFAAGNNVGLRLALSQSDMDSVWVLNNDTLVEPDCLQEMQAVLRSEGGRVAVGSMIHFFEQPEIIQAMGGNRFNHKTGVAACSEGRFVHEKEAPCAKQVGEILDYLSGCSMLLPRAFLEEVGHITEEYFLYYEEIDWFTRARNRFPMRIAAGACLYHREGSAIGSPTWRRGASCFSDYHMLRSRFIFMHKYYRRWLPICYLVGCLDALKRLMKGQFNNASTVMSVLLGRRGSWLPA